MVHAWHFLGSTTLQRLGRLTLREDAWRLPTGVLRRYPVLPSRAAADKAPEPAAPKAAPAAPVKPAPTAPAPTPPPAKK